MRYSKKVHRSTSGLFEIMNFVDEEYNGTIAKDVREGLTASQKYLPCKYLYDASGSKLFEDICCLPEYYPTRTELSILEDIAPELMGGFNHKELVELGSGANVKIRVLLDAAGKTNRATLRYIPVDISESAVIEASLDLIERYPELQVLGIVADFTSQLDLVPTEYPLMFCFLGSTIGNMEKEESISFLQSVSENMKWEDRLLIGFDMVKSRETLESAYNDAQGTTSEFNKNILSVLNNELNADFDSSCFDHLAFYNDEHDRIEMHLRAKCDFSVNIESIGEQIEFHEGETIHTENSRKFTRKSIEDMARQANLNVENWHSDPNGWFSIVEMITDPLAP